ncbi:MAG: hypothetical protein RL701_3739 [Pseudomonadota bacterium]|jgi:hypothetical protein
MTQPTLVKDLFNRPKAVRKGDFVLLQTLRGFSVGAIASDSGDHTRAFRPERALRMSRS